MNKPTSSNKAGLVDWDKLNEAKDKWQQNLREIHLSNDAMLKLVLRTIDEASAKIRESLGHVFEIRTQNWKEVEHGYIWKFMSVRNTAYGPIETEAFRVTLNVVKSDQYSDCNNFYAQVLKSIRFHTYAGNEHRELIADTIEELFQHERVINTIMKYV
jgi:hypothetical protein